MKNPQDTHESKYYIDQSQLTKHTHTQESPANHAKKKSEINPN